MPFYTGVKHTSPGTALEFYFNHLKKVDMYTIIIAIIIVAVVGFFILGLVSIHNRQARKMTGNLVERLGIAAEKENFKFSKTEILGSDIIGLDDSCNKLMILKRTGDEYHTLIIDLNEVRDCSKKKLYHKVDISMGKRERFEHHVEQIVLNFDIPLQHKQENIIFYDSGIHGLRDLTEAGQKADEWETRIRKILLHTHQKRA